MCVFVCEWVWVGKGRERRCGGREEGVRGRGGEEGG